MSFDGRRLQSAAELKALAHPLRMEIIEQLSLHGPMTASELGEALDEIPANCSWHLRKLAEAKFVEEAGGGKGRRRPWQMTSIGFTFSRRENDAPGAAAFNVIASSVRSLIVRREIDRFEHNMQVGDNWDLGMSQNAIYLTQEEAKSLSAHLVELILEHRGRLTGEEPVPEGARLVHVMNLVSLAPEEEA